MEPPSIEKIREVRERLADKVLTTPVFPWRPAPGGGFPGNPHSLSFKLELFQYGGSFKPRGALNNMLGLEKDALTRGVTGVSAGNHAIALAYAAKILNTTAKVVMPDTADPYRIQKCREWGGEVILVKDVHEAFEKEKEVRDREGRTFIHPFDGPGTAEGTGTVGLELTEQTPTPLDILTIPIGGGGLAAGISSAIKQVWPDCEVYGVEPEGADTMTRSFKTGKPESIDKVRTIADSLGAPYTAEYSMNLCRKHLEDVVLVSDDQLRETIRTLYDRFHLAVEPAGAASLAALTGPLKEKMENKKAGVIMCGTNTGIEKFREHFNT